MAVEDASKRVMVEGREEARDQTMCFFERGRVPADSTRYHGTICYQIDG
jgi:hypothetical protein